MTDHMTDNEISDDQLKLLQEYSAALLPPGEIAILMGIPPNERKEFAVRCRTRVGDPLYEAFHLGRLTTKLELRTNIIKLAKAGSPAAEPLAEKFLREQHLD